MNHSAVNHGSSRSASQVDQRPFTTGAGQWPVMSYGLDDISFGAIIRVTRSVTQPAAFSATASTTV